MIHQQPKHSMNGERLRILSEIAEQMAGRTVSYDEILGFTHSLYSDIMGNTSGRDEDKNLAAETFLGYTHHHLTGGTLEMNRLAEALSLADEIAGESVKLSDLTHLHSYALDNATNTREHPLVANTLRQGRDADATFLVSLAHFLVGNNPLAQKHFLSRQI